MTEWDGRKVIASDVTLGSNVVIPHPELVNLYGCQIGDGCKIASFVEIQRGAVLGKNVKVEAFAFIPTGVMIEDGAFIGSDSLLRAPIKIGARSVTGAGSVVTKDVPDDMLAVGVPARIRKKTERKDKAP